MEAELRNKILDANISEHRLEASYYDTIHVEIFNRFEQRRLDEALDEALAGAALDSVCLDIGAGTGNISAKLLERGYANLVCVDISEEMLRELRKKTGIESSRVYCMDADSFLRDDERRYAFVSISSVVHHLPEYKATLAEVFARLVPGGALFITHEPCASPGGRGLAARAVEMLVRRCDHGYYVSRYLALAALGRLKFLGRDCRYSDYHTGERLVEPAELAAFFEALGAEVRPVRYAVARSAFAAALLQRVTSNAYEMIVRKPVSSERMN